MRVAIAGVGKCLPGTDVPGRIVDNEEIVRILLAHGAAKPGANRPWTPEELTPSKIENLVGIRQRQWADNEINNSDLALFAAEKAMGEAGIGWEDIGILTLGSSTPEAYFPSTASMVLNKVIRKKVAAGEWSEQEAKTKLRIPASDVLAACTSSLYAMDIVRRFLLADETPHEYGLAIGSEVMSRLMNFTDANSDLFGDGAGAVVLKKTEGPSGILWSEMGGDPLGLETTYSFGMDTRWHETPVPKNIFLSGHDVQKFVLKIIPELIVRAVENVNKTSGLGRRIGLDDIALFICHQANSRIFDFPSKKLGIPLEKFYVNVDRRGNCSSASLLIALREALDEGRIRKGDLVLLLSFGGGLTWGAILVQW